MKFTRELFSKYFLIIKKGLSQLSLLSSLEEQLQEFYDGLLNPSRLVPGARLKDKAAEIVEHSIRAAMTKTFQDAESKVQGAILDLLQTLGAPVKGGPPDPVPSPRGESTE